MSVACPSFIVPTAIASEVDATRPVSGNPVAFVRVAEAGVPNTALSGIVTVPVNVGLAIGAYVDDAVDEASFASSCV